MHETHRQRLSDLADLLDRKGKWKDKPPIPARRFDMSSWGYQNECGTSACAGGYAALDPHFQKQGLKSKWVDSCWLGRKKALLILYSVGRGNGAISLFFGPEANEALIFADNTNTPKAKAKQIRKLLKEHEAS